MKQIGTYQAKTHFGQIIEKVREGEVFLITKNGKPVAKIIPVTNEKEQLLGIMNEVVELRKSLKNKGLNLKSIMEG